MDPIRVLLVAPSLDILGGQAVQADRLWKLFQNEPDLKVDLLPVNPRLPGPLGRLQKVKYLRTVATSAAYFWSLRRVRQYDVVHAFSASYWSFLLAPVPALLAARIFRKASILNYRSGEAEDHLQTWKTAGWGARLATRIIVPSGYLVEVFGRFGLLAQAVFNTIDRGRYEFRRRSPIQPRFFSNRNFEPLYNVACTIQCFSIVRRRFPNATLTLAGDGPQRGALEALCQSLGLSGATFLGRVDPAQMADCYAGQDIYLNSPDIDNMPSSILEAFSSGLPIVTTDAGGIPFLIEHGRTGRMVDSGDAQAMAREAIWILENPSEAQEMAESAYRESERYTWQTVRVEWLRVYRELAARAASQPFNS